MVQFNTDLQRPLIGVMGDTLSHMGMRRDIPGPQATAGIMPGPYGYQPQQPVPVPGRTGRAFVSTDPRAAQLQGSQPSAGVPPTPLPASRSRQTHTSPTPAPQVSAPVTPQVAPRSNASLASSTDGPKWAGYAQDAAAGLATYNPANPGLANFGTAMSASLGSATSREDRKRQEQLAADERAREEARYQTEQWWKERIWGREDTRYTSEKEESESDETYERSRDTVSDRREEARLEAELLARRAQATAAERRNLPGVGARARSRSGPSAEQISQAYERAERVVDARIEAGEQLDPVKKEEEIERVANERLSSWTGEMGREAGPPDAKVGDVERGQPSARNLADEEKDNPYVGVEPYKLGNDELQTHKFKRMPTPEELRKRGLVKGDWIRYYDQSSGQWMGRQLLKDP